MNKVIDVLSLGCRYYAASLLYFGLALLLAGALPYPTQAHAQTSGCPEQACPIGQKCCQGHCIPNSDVCCDDGSHGPSSSGGKNCGCVACCTDAQCTSYEPTTYKCEQ